MVLQKLLFITWKKKGQISGINYNNNNNENTLKRKKPTRVFHGFGISHYYIIYKIRIQE